MQPKNQATVILWAGNLRFRISYFNDKHNVIPGTDKLVQRAKKNALIEVIEQATLFAGNRKEQG